jgi:hypothetical protein
MGQSKRVMGSRQAVYLMQTPLLIPIMGSLRLVGLETANVMRLAKHQPPDKLIGLLANLAAGCVLFLLSAMLVSRVGVIRE